MLNVTYLIRRLCILLFVGFFLTSTALPALANDSDHAKRVVIVNQVRGTACCDAGSLSAFKDQLSVLRELQLPAVFALRYDALTSEYTHLLAQGDFEPAAFLEITPQLAADAGVVYTGTPENWYQAHHAYTLGYALEDRKKLVDTYMVRYKEHFGSYPALVVSWILDTPSANYLQTTYQVRGVEITREQWGTDSYTLSGGPVHYPYQAARNWLFMPAAQNAATPSLVVFRQTNADPLYNYGDSTSAFTTQPNDYVRDGKGFDYFARLATGLLSQSSEPYSFLLLGLENSMPAESQKAFAAQLRWLAEQGDAGVKVVGARSFLEEATEQGWLSPAVTAMSGRDTVADDPTRQSFWITTPHYRVRLLRTGESLKLTDLRVYSPELHDPYTSYVGQNNGFWVAPFILDGSRFYADALPPSTLRARATLWLKRRLLPEYQQQYQEPQLPKNDLRSQPVALPLPKLSASQSSPLEVSAENGGRTLRYVDENGKEVMIFFTDDHIAISGQGVQSLLTNQLREIADELPMQQYDPQSGLSWKDGALRLELHCAQSQQCELHPVITNPVNVDEYRVSNYPYVFPEVVDRTLSTTASTFYAHSKYSIAGRNPARLVVLPKDESGFRTQLIHEPQITTQPPVSGISIKPQDGATGLVFIDILESKPGAYIVSLSFDGSSTRQERIFLAPDCQSQLAYCVVHPWQASWFVAARFFERLRSW